MGNAVATPSTPQTQTTPVVSPSISTTTIDKSDRSVLENVIYYNCINGEELIVYTTGFLITSNSQDNLLESQTKPISNTNIEYATILSSNLLLTFEADDSLRLYRIIDGVYIGNFLGDSDTPSDESKESEHKPVFPILDDITHGQVQQFHVLNNDRIAIGFSSGEVVVYTTSGTELFTLFYQDRAPSAVTSLSYDKNRMWLFVGCADGSIKIFSTETTDIVSEIRDHSEKVNSLCFCTFADVLLSSSEDGTLRAWNVDTGKELCGYKFSATSLHYDEIRDLVFCATSEGCYSIAKVVVSINGRGTDIKLLKKVQVSESPLNKLFYNTLNDMLVAVTDDKRAIFKENITDISYETALSRVQEAQEISIGSVEEALEELKRSDNPDTEWEEQIIVNKKKFVDSCLQIADEGGTRVLPPESIKKELMSCVNSMLSSFETIKIETSRVKQDIYQRFQSSFFPQTAKDELEQRFIEEEEDIKQRHQRELEAFRLKCERERKHFAESTKLYQRQAVALTTSLKRKQVYCKYQAEADTSESIKKYIQNSLPVINYRYQLGSPLSSSTTSVFKGLDLDTGDYVAIKALPAEINLDTSLKHDSLVPVLDVCSVNSTLFVVMKLMKENLFDFVAKLPDQKLEPFQTAYIIHSILSSICYLHSKRMVVRDLRPQHILMDFHSQPKLIHLGIMRSLLGAPTTEPKENQRRYVAPEIFCRVVKGSSDIWSCGCILLYLLQDSKERQIPLFDEDDTKSILASMMRLAGRPPVEELRRMPTTCKMDKDGIELLTYLADLSEEQATPKFTLKEICVNAPPLAMDLMMKMLQFIPEKRLSALEALQHPYFQQFKQLPSVDADLLLHTELTLSTQSLTETSDVSDSEEPDLVNKFKEPKDSNV